MTGRERTVLLAGATAIGAILVGGRLVPAGHRWYTAAAERVEMQRAAVGQLQARLGSARALSDSLAFLEGAVTSFSERMLLGATDEAAHLDLVRRITAAAADSVPAIDSIRFEPPSLSDSAPAPRYGDVALTETYARVWVTADLAGVARLLAGIEADPALWVERLAARAELPNAPGPESIATEIVVAAWRITSS